MPKKTAQELVEQYRQLNADGDPDLDGEDVLTKVIRTKDPEGVRLLLTLYPTQAEWDRDEMGEVVSALKNAPKKLFVPVFAGLAAQVCRDTPELFDDLIVYVGLSGLKPFLAALPPLANEDRERMVKRIDDRHTEVWAGDEIPPDVQERHARLVAGIRGSAG
jgi:hypothetical protein